MSSRKTWWQIHYLLSYVADIAEAECIIHIWAGGEDLLSQRHVDVKGMIPHNDSVDTFGFNVNMIH